MYFAIREMPLTLVDGKERGSYIRKVIINGKMKYYIAGYIDPGAHNTVVGEAIMGFVTGDYSIDYNSIVFDEITGYLDYKSVYTPKVAFVHTHPDCDCHYGSDFSDEDLFLSDVIKFFYNDENAKMYLVATDGNLYRVNYVDGKQVVETVGMYK